LNTYYLISFHAFFIIFVVGAYQVSATSEDIDPINKFPDTAIYHQDVPKLPDLVSRYEIKKRADCINRLINAHKIALETGDGLRALPQNIKEIVEKCCTTNNADPAQQKENLKILYKQTLEKVLSLKGDHHFLIQELNWPLLTLQEKSWYYAKNYWLHVALFALAVLECNRSYHAYNVSFNLREIVKTLDQLIEDNKKLAKKVNKKLNSNSGLYRTINSEEEQ
jgi:hypothetical protein